MRRVHASTGIVCLIVLAILAFLNFVGERDDRLYVLEGERVCHHGWPFTYLTRRPDAQTPTGGGFFSVPSGGFACGGAGFMCGTCMFAAPPDLSIWKPTSDAAEFRGTRLLLNLFTSLAIVASTGFLCERRIRRHGGLARMGMKDLLSTTTLLAIGSAWFAGEWREGTRQSVLLAKLDSELCSVELVQTWPDWLVELVGAKRLQPFERVAYATLGDPDVDWYATEEQSGLDALVGRLSRQVTVLSELRHLERLILWNPPPNEAFLRELAVLSELEVIEVGCPFGAFFRFADTAGESFEDRLQLHLEDLYFADWRRDFVSNLLILETVREVVPDVKVVAE